MTDKPHDVLADIISTDEAAKLLRLSSKSIRPLVSSGRLPLSRYRLGGRNYFSRAEVIKHIESCRIPAREAAQ